MAPLFTGPSKFFRRIALKRNDTTTLDPDDYIKVTDDNNNVLAGMRNDGSWYMVNYTDWQSSGGRVENRVLNDATAEFRIYNVNGNFFHFRAFPQAFYAPGSSYTNGSATYQPFQFRGVKPTSGAPTDGTWTTGDVILDAASPRRWWVCTAGGTPGTWS